MIEIKPKQAGASRKLDLSQRLMDFSVQIIRIAEEMSSSFSSRHIAKQLLRSATSSGANYEEACGAESRADFVHKLQVVLKELKESKYWLDLILLSELMPNTQISPLLTETEELANIIAQSVLTAKQNIKEKLRNEKDGFDRK